MRDGFVRFCPFHVRSCTNCALGQTRCSIYSTTFAFLQFQGLRGEMMLRSHSCRRGLHLLRSESPCGKCAKLHTVAASNNRDHLGCSRHMQMGVILRAYHVKHFQTSGLLCVAGSSRRRWFRPNFYGRAIERVKRVVKLGFTLVVCNR